MKIRALTLFSEPTYDPMEAIPFFDVARSAFHVPVQTSRVGTTPFPTWCDPSHYLGIQIQEFFQPWQEIEVDFICLGPVMLGHDADWLNQLPDIVVSNENVFVSSVLNSLGLPMEE
jgi:hypothetical protein